MGKSYGGSQIMGPQLWRCGCSVRRKTRFPFKSSYVLFAFMLLTSISCSHINDVEIFTHDNSIHASCSHSVCLIRCTDSHEPLAWEMYKQKSLSENNEKGKCGVTSFKRARRFELTYQAHCHVPNKLSNSSRTLWITFFDLWNIMICFSTVSPVFHFCLLVW